MMELEVGKEFLMAVCNEAMLHKKATCTVSSPLLNVDLLKINLELGEIIWVARREEFDTVISELRLKIRDSALQNDLPDYSDLREVFQGSVLLPENMRDLLQEMREMEERKNDPFRYPKQKCLGIDTNIAYRRLLTRLLGYEGVSRPKELSARCVQILLPSLVEEEISARVGRKYSGRDLDELRRAIGNQRMIGSLINCCFKDGRKALNAQTEIKILKERYNTWDVKGGEYSKDKEVRDKDIVKSLASHAANQELELVYVTTDDKSVAHAVAYKVRSLHLKYPLDIPEKLKVDHWLLVELLYDLSLVFATISLKGLGITIMGDWAGKSTDEYYRERLKLVIDDSSSLREILERDHRIVSRLERTVDLRKIV